MDSEGVAVDVAVDVVEGEDGNFIKNYFATTDTVIATIAFFHILYKKRESLLAGRALIANKPTSHI